MGYGENPGDRTAIEFKAMATHLPNEQNICNLWLTVLASLG